MSQRKEIIMNKYVSITTVAAVIILLIIFVL